MSFLRLSTNCAVFDDQGQVLLSKRRDLNVWNLPGGRLDSNESLLHAAAREVREETGLITHVERGVGLYYWEGWQRLNILFMGFPVGGELLQRTYETGENRFFAVDGLPETLRDRHLVQDAIGETRPLPQVITTPPTQLRMTRWKLRRRYVTNFLRGKPEPRHVRFNLQAVGIVWEAESNRVLTISNQRMRSLPRVVCDGSAPWSQLARFIGRYLETRLTFQWVGVWQYPQTDSLELVFAATVYDHALSQAEWSSAQNGALNERDARYVQQTSPDYLAASVWMLSV
ncbi:MAG: NUDIX domain-containing protein [Anaerolineae bacterium]|jgi:ADP-ribose pyrophosphatase YjhB (NUDIX family)|nr:NUDIX domain-containing protein [Anaerolineae bacterium]